MSESITPPETIAPSKPSGAYAALSSEYRSFMFWHAIVGAAIVNVILNALIAWLSVRNEDSVPRWAVPLVDKPSTISDTIGTAEP
jgi:hypothetical protein